MQGARHELLQKQNTAFVTGVQLLILVYRECAGRARTGVRHTHIFLAGKEQMDSEKGSCGRVCVGRVRQNALRKHVPCLRFLLGIWPSSKRSRMRPVAVSPNSRTSRLTALPLLPPLPPSPPSLLPPPLPPPPLPPLLPPPPLPPLPLLPPPPATSVQGHH